MFTWLKVSCVIVVWVLGMFVHAHSTTLGLRKPRHSLQLHFSTFSSYLDWAFFSFSPLTPTSMDLPAPLIPSTPTTRPANFSDPTIPPPTRGTGQADRQMEPPWRLSLEPHGQGVLGWAEPVVIAGTCGEQIKALPWALAPCCTAP